MLKELFEGHFYGTFPNVTNRVLNLSERTGMGTFSLFDEKACRDCHYPCNNNPADREQMKVTCQAPVYVISMDDVFSYVKDDMGEICDYMLEGKDAVAIVEMTCSTSSYVTEKRRKARRQLYNTLTNLMTSPVVKEHIEQQANRYVVFSWKETFESNAVADYVEKNMTDMTVMADEAYSSDNESNFDFGFKLKEIRYPYALAM